MIKTKQEILNHFSNINVMYNNPFEYQTLSNMIDELLEQEPSEDCISRKDTIEWLKKVTVTDGITFKTGFEQILYDIEQMPPVTPQPKIGRWIAYTDHQACSCCGNWIAYYENDFNFCPNCGAKMDEESKTEQALAYADQDTLMPAT